MLFFIKIASLKDGIFSVTHSAFYTTCLILPINFLKKSIFYCHSNDLMNKKLIFMKIINKVEPLGIEVFFDNIKYFPCFDI
jgi:hypothetical protein